MCWFYPLLDLKIDNPQDDNDERPKMEESSSYRFPGLVAPQDDAHLRYITPHLIVAAQKKDEMRKN